MHARDDSERAVARGRDRRPGTGVRQVADRFLFARIHIRLVAHRVSDVAEEGFAGVTVVVAIEPVWITWLGVQIRLCLFLTSEINAIEITVGTHRAGRIERKRHG